MLKSSHSDATRISSRNAQEELSELMDLLGKVPDSDDSEPVEDEDIVALLEGLGSSAREREEHEVQQLLEGLPELHGEGVGDDLGSLSSLIVSMKRSSPPELGAGGGSDGPLEDEFETGSALLALSSLAEEAIETVEDEDGSEAPDVEPSRLPAADSAGNLPAIPPETAEEARVRTHLEEATIEEWAQAREALAAAVESISGLAVPHLHARGEDELEPVEALEAGPDDEGELLASVEHFPLREAVSAEAPALPPIFAVDPTTVEELPAEGAASPADAELVQDLPPAHRARSESALAGPVPVDHARVEPVSAVSAAGAGPSTVASATRPGLPDFALEASLADAAQSLTADDALTDSSDLPLPAAHIALSELLPLAPPVRDASPRLVPPTRQRQVAASAHAGSGGLEQEVVSDAALPPVRDPLASRRAVADERLEQFMREDVTTLTNLRILRLLVVSGIDRISLEELQEELVAPIDTLSAGLHALESAGLVLLDGSAYQLNTRARKLSLLGTAIAQWQTPRKRSELLEWLEAR